MTANVEIQPLKELHRSISCNVNFSLINLHDFTKRMVFGKDFT
jgi:hypothetical protein